VQTESSSEMASIRPGSEPGRTSDHLTTTDIRNGSANSAASRLHEDIGERSQFPKPTSVYRKKLKPVCGHNPTSFLFDRVWIASASAEVGTALLMKPPVSGLCVVNPGRRSAERADHIDESVRGGKRGRTLCAAHKMCWAQVKKRLEELH
jgi:hypothetical protein